MEVRNDYPRSGDEVDEVVAGLHGLERREPDAAGRRIGLQSREEIDEACPAVVAERGEVDAREDDLGDAAVPEATNRVGDVLDPGAALFPAQRGHDAKRASAFAAVLDLQKGTGPLGV
jgi:hypothetical protein